MARLALIIIIIKVSFQMQYMVHSKIVIVKTCTLSIAIFAKCIAIQIASKVSRYIDASMNRAKTNKYRTCS